MEGGDCSKQSFFSSGGKGSRVKLKPKRRQLRWVGAFLFQQAFVGSVFFVLQTQPTRDALFFPWPHGLTSPADAWEQRKRTPPAFWRLRQCLCCPVVPWFSTSFWVKVSPFFSTNRKRVPFLFPMATGHLRF